MTEKQFERAKFLDNEIQHLKNIQRLINSEEFLGKYPVSIQITFNDGNKIYLEESFIKTVFGKYALKTDVKRFVGKTISLLEAEFKTLVSNEQQ